MDVATNEMLTHVGKGARLVFTVAHTYVQHTFPKKYVSSVYKTTKTKSKGTTRIRNCNVTTYNMYYISLPRTGQNAHTYILFCFQNLCCIYYPTPVVPWKGTVYVRRLEVNGDASPQKRSLCTRVQGYYLVCGLVPY